MRLLSSLKSGLAVAVTSAAFFSTPSPAQAYQVDCAILLCLSGGWPASAPCAHARAVFIRRITPWPIEPPLQIWRCPMRMSSGTQRTPSQALYDLAFENAPPPMSSYPDDDYYYDTVGDNPYKHPRDASAPSANAARKATAADLRDESGRFDPRKFLHHVAGEVSDENGFADIDISGSEFDFVRSIRVWDVRSYRHTEQGENGDCRERSWMFLGTYGAQGDFDYRRTSHVGAPEWVLPNRSCGWGSWRRGVGVEWQDYEGNHDYEWVSY